MIVIPENKVVPPSDAIKTGVINRLEELHSSYNDLLYYFYLGTKRKTVDAKFKSSIIAFYTSLRPKILDYIRSLKEISNTIAEGDTADDAEDYSNLIGWMDRYIDRPDKFTIEECMEVFKWLNQFCEEYGLTKTAFRQQEIPGLGEQHPSVVPGAL